MSPTKLLYLVFYRPPNMYEGTRDDRICFRKLPFVENVLYMDT